MAQSSEATRSSVIETSARGQSFFEKLSGGFSAVQESVASLEELTEEVSSNFGILDTPKLAKKEKIEKNQKQTTITSNDAFFDPESAILANFTSIYEETTKLHETLTTCPVNIDPLEGRLLALRERLLKLEEKPRLLKGGYKPYIPPKSPAEQLASYEGEKVVMVTPYKLFSTTTEAVKSGTQVENEKNAVKQAIPKTPLLKSTSSPVEFDNCDNSSSNIPILTSSSSSILAKNSSSDSSVSNPVVVDAKIAKCLSILDRWNSVSSEDVSKTANEAASFAAPSIPRNITFVKPKTPDLGSLSSSAKVDDPRPQTSTLNTFCSNTPKPPGSAFKPNVNITRSKTFTLNSNSFPNLEATPANNSAEDSDYETVEFTPGMFSRVPKKR